MKVVSYARVSTLRQESEGESLANQERAFVRWLERGGHERIASYQDTKSAGTIAQRDEFLRMIHELRRTKPDAIIVDTLDRFTRNLRDGLNVLEELRGHHVGLLPLDWRREKPIDVDDDRDWAEVVDEFTGAESERRRIRRRVRRSRAERAERGATNTYNPPLGIMKKGDRLVPDPQTAWLIAQIDVRFLSGATLADLAKYALALHPDAWTTYSGVRKALANHAYVVAGVRRPEDQRQIDSLLEEMTKRFGRVHKWEHEFAGVFLCGPCFDAGYRNLMSAAFTHAKTKKQSGKAQLICDRRRWGQTGHPDRYFCVSVDRVEPAWHAFIETLSAPEAVDRFASAESREVAEQQRQLGSRLAHLDQSLAALKSRRDAAFDLLADSDREMQSQARKMLSEVERDEAAIGATRGVLLGELASVPTPRRDPAMLREGLAAYRETYARRTTVERNRLNRALCAAIGSNPRVYRDGKPRSKWSTVRVEWPEVTDDVSSVSSSCERDPSDRRPSESPPSSVDRTRRD